MTHAKRTRGEERGPYRESNARTSDRTRSALDRSKRLVAVGLNPLFALAVGLTSEEDRAKSMWVYTK